MISPCARQGKISLSPAFTKPTDNLALLAVTFGADRHCPMIFSQPNDGPSWKPPGPQMKIGMQRPLGVIYGRSTASNGFTMRMNSY
jgi:hypothetical protein